MSKSYGSITSSGSGPPKTTKSFNRSCPFHIPADNVKFNNKPWLPMKLFIKVIHFAERKMMEAGGFDSNNMLVRAITTILYTLDLIQFGVDPSFYLKRREVFGDNFVAFCSLHIGKYDGKFISKDSVDARVVTYPQAKLLRIGALPSRPKGSFWYGPKGERGFGWNLSPLMASDRGTTPNPICERGTPDHTEIRDFLNDNFAGKSHIDAAIVRQTDATGSKLLEEFGENIKGKKGKEIEAIIEDFLRTWMTYCLLDVPIENIPKDLLDDLMQIAFFNNQVLAPGAPLNGKPNRKIAKNTILFQEFIENESGLMKNFKPGPKGLGKKELSKAIPMVFITAAFLGTRDLTNWAMLQAPAAYLESVVNNDAKLRNAVLEVARLNTPVPFSGQPVDDNEGLTTQIGGKTFTFKKGTPTVNLLQMANIDENRYPDPYVFNPENRDFSKLTSFNSVGESSQKDSPHICPGREFSIVAAMNMIKAKIAAEKDELPQYGANI